MANQESCQQALCSFIINICARERLIEMKRQLLCQNQDFEPYVAFSRLTRNRNEGLSSGVIYEFLTESGIPTSLKRCQLLVSYLDQDKKGLIGFKTFLEMVLPKEHP